MKWLICGAFAGLAVLGGCASAPVAELKQTRAEKGCLSVEGEDMPETKMCPTRINFGGTFISSSDEALCVLYLDIRADGTVSRVKVPVAKPRSFESQCIRNAYRWRFETERGEEPVELRGVKAVVAINYMRDIEVGPELDSGHVRISFNSDAIDSILKN